MQTNCSQPSAPQSAPIGGAQLNKTNTVTSTKNTKRKTSAEDKERDKKLVAAVQNGDAAAFRELFDRYNQRAYSVALGVVKNPQDALDIVQEGFVKVHKHISKFEGSSSFYTWLYRIIMNLSIDHIRRTKRATRIDYDDRVLRAADEIEGDGTIMPDILGSSPKKSVLRRELSEAISAALEELPEHHRAVILLREVEGMTYEEMAVTLEVPKGTIMSRLFHARRKMQESLDDYIRGELQIREDA